MARKGETWNESETYRDALTLRQVRRITSYGLYNQTPTYHTNVGFTADGEYLVFASGREGWSAAFKCHVATGDITQLTDPAPGMGEYGEAHRQTGSSVGNGLGVTGVDMCIAPRSHWVTFMAGRALCAAHLDTLAERTLIADIGADWIPGVPTVDPSETHVILPVIPAHPDILAGRRPTLRYYDYFAHGGMRSRLLRVPLAGGPVTIVHEEEGASCAHCPHCPSDGDLLELDRDLAPGFWGGSDGKTNRLWTLRLSTGQLTELPPRDRARFQMHCAWTWDGQHVIYHGVSAESGWYIGAVDRNGQTWREYAFRKAGSYGHVSAMAGRPAIILDGNLSTDQLLWLYYDKEQPRVEIIARHGSAWGALPWQYAHPHALSDPTGRWISFNAASAGRADVFVVTV